MKFIELTKHLKEGIVSLYNLQGEDFFLIKQAITNIKAVVIKELEEIGERYNKLVKQQGMIHLLRYHKENNNGN